ncbi:MAG: class I SAM-dependent methyltransferase [Pseudomonadota bacterium]
MNESMVLDHTLETVDKIRPSLTGVPETMLWPLWNRAVSSAERNPLVSDPWAEHLVGKMDFDFAGHFGKPSVFHAIRARVGDDLVREYASWRSCPTVIALGEGLDSQRLRVNEDSIRWYSVDVPEASALREQLIERPDEETRIAKSALDLSWMDEVNDCDAPFISASGLFMYFEEKDVREMLAAIAARFPGADLYFDTIPQFFSRKTLKGFAVTPQYTAPRMPWGIGTDDIANFVKPLGFQPVSVRTYAEPYPDRLKFFAFLSKFHLIRNTLAGSLAHLRANPR